MIKIAPSILSADFARLGAEVDSVRAGGADWLHFDVMDGLFVPNISVGVPVLKSLRKYTDLFLDVHLMIDRPGRFVSAFSEAGADLICIHLEADTAENIHAALKEIRRLNGPDTQIICALGSMSYYLFPEIEQAVRDYRKETGDERIRNFRYRPMAPLDGFGAAGHPSLATQKKMGQELAEFIRSI